MIDIVLLLLLLSHLASATCGVKVETEPTLVKRQIIDLNTKHKTAKILQENIRGKRLRGLQFGNGEV